MEWFLALAGTILVTTAIISFWLVVGWLISKALEKLGFKIND